MSFGPFLSLRWLAIAAAEDATILGVAWLFNLPFWAYMTLAVSVGLVNGVILVLSDRRRNTGPAPAQES